MTQRTVALSIVLAFSLPPLFSGCDGTAHLTEQERIQRAKDFEDKNNLKSSIIELKNILQKHPASKQARLMLGQVYLKAGMGVEAEKELSQAEQLGVNPELVKPLLGEALIQMGEYKRVLDEIQPGSQTSQTNLARIFQLRANALLKQGKLKEACGLFQQSLDVATDNPQAYWGLAQCAVAERDMAKAKKWLDTALKIKDRQATSWVFVGDWEQLNNNPQGALRAYSNALKAEPENASVLKSHATMLMKLGQLQAASQEIEKLNKLAPKSLDAYYTQALLDFQQRKYTAARDNLQEVFKFAPGHMPSVLLAGTTAYMLGSYQQAESLLNRFLSRFPSHSYAIRVLAATQIKQNQPANALKTLAPLLLPDTKDAAALALAGEANSLLQQPAQAAEFLERAKTIDPKNASIHTQLGLNNIAMGNAQLAVSELEAASTLSSGQYQADILLIMTHLIHKDYDKALAAIDTIEKKLPNNPAILNLRGKAYLEKNDPVNARKSFEQALAIDGAFFPAAASLAQLDMRDKKPEVARQRFEKLLSKDKNNLQAMMALATLAEVSAQDKDQVNWLEKAKKTHPEAIAPREALVRHYLSRNERETAQAEAIEAVNDNQDNLDALKLLGATQMAVGDKAAAIVTFTKLTKRADQSPDAYMRLAMAQIANNKSADARSSLAKALQIRPNHLASQDALIRLELSEKRPEAALQIARQIQKQAPGAPMGYDREGDIQFARQRLPLAVKAYEQALAKGAGSITFIKLHRAQSLAGDRKLAEQSLNTWLRQRPGDNTVLAYSAAYFMGIGRNNDAIAHYQELLKRVPANALTLNNLANLYQRTQDSRALKTAEQAFKLAPDNPAILDTLGWILVEQGQTSRSLDLLRKAAARAPEVATISYHFAVALSRAGDRALARKVLDQALRRPGSFPESDAARALLKSL